MKERRKAKHLCLKNNEGQQSCGLKSDLCVGPFVAVTWPLLADAGLLRGAGYRMSPIEKQKGWIALMERNTVRQKQKASKNPELGVSQNELFFSFTPRWLWGDKKRLRQVSSARLYWKKNQQNETNTLKTSNRNKYCWKSFLKYIASSNSTGEFMTPSLSFLEGVDQKNTVNMNVKSHEGASC